MTNGATYLFDGHSFCPGVGLPLTDRGFRYGMSVFETIALREGRPLLLDAHLASLANAANRTSFRPPPRWLEAIREVLAASPIQEGVVRIYLTGGDHEGDLARAALLCEAMPIPTVLTGARAVTVDFTPALPFGKTGNYWPHLLACPPGEEEAVLCTPGGLLLGGAMANLFLIIDDTLLTPRQPVRRGVVHDWIAASEADLHRSDVNRAAAAFLTNSRFGMRPLTSINGRALPGHAQVETIWRRYRSEVLGVG